MVQIQRMQTGVRLEVRLVKVLKGLAEYFDISFGELVEGIALHALDQTVPFGAETRRVIEQLRAVYGLDLRAEDSHQLLDREEDAAGDAPGRITVSGVVQVPLGPAEAFRLFTPSGERSWVKDWSPRFPVAVDDETVAGTVFETTHGGEHTTWIVTACEPAKTITYARITDDRAGTVTVDCRDAGGDTTRAHVTYTLTALRASAKHYLAAFAANYGDLLEHWEQAISATLGGPRPPGRR